LAYIINIDTSGVTGSICLAEDGIPVKTYINQYQKDHASVLGVYLSDIINQFSLSKKNVLAVAISGGPGSYTGLRVATATAKGLCYAWDLPLIAVNTLQMMANGVKMQAEDSNHALGKQAFLYCPMIDARRNEVYAALYDLELNEIMSPKAMILLPDSFSRQLASQTIYFFGDGSKKFKGVVKNNTNSLFIDYELNASHLASLSYHFYLQKRFENLAYFEPFYLKEFYHPAEKK
jgi:tRNA threonylcarbamoyladenosine biosynthesis protein TsaB